MRSRNIKPAVFGEIRFVDSRSAFYGCIRKSWYFLVNHQSKWEIFTTLWGKKWHMQTGGNAVLSGQPKVKKSVALTRSIEDDTFPLLEKQSEEISHSFRSAQCTLVTGSKSFFVAYIGVIESH